MAAFDFFPAVHHLLDTIVEGDRRGAGRTGHAFLQADRHRIDAPAVDLERHAADGGGGVDIEEHVVLAADFPDLVERLRHGGGCIPLDAGDQLRAMLADCGADRIRLEHPAPVGLDGDHVGADPLRNLFQEMAETPKHRDQHAVAGREDRGQAGLDAGARRAVDQKRPMVARAENAPVERHDIVHVGGEFGVELAEHGGRHGAQDARIDVDGARPHQQPRRWVERTDRRDFVWLNHITPPQGRRVFRSRRAALQSWGTCRLSSRTARHDRSITVGCTL